MVTCCSHAQTGEIVPQTPHILIPFFPELDPLSSSCELERMPRGVGREGRSLKAPIGDASVNTGARGKAGQVETRVSSEALIRDALANLGPFLNGAEGVKRGSF